MTERPPIRRSPTAPTTGSRAPMAGAAERGSRSHDIDALPEDTRDIEIPDAGELVERVLDLIGAEAEALLLGDDPDGRLADLNVRIALASWDGLREPAEALRYLELAEAHPLAPRLRVAGAIDLGAPDALAAARSAVDLLASSPVKDALLVDLAEAALFRRGEAANAAVLAERALAGALGGAARRHVVALATLAHAAAGAWTDVAKIRRAELDASTSDDERAVVVALLLDRAGDASGALQLAGDPPPPQDTSRAPPGRSAASDPAAATATGTLRLIDVALDAALRAGDPRSIPLLERRAALLEALAGGQLEALATLHALAATLAREGRTRDAANLWARLADHPAATQPGSARRIALLAAAWAAAAANDVLSALAARRQLADSDCAEIAIVHGWRALELAAVAGEPPHVLRELARTLNAATSSPLAAWWLDVLDHDEPSVAQITRLALRGGLALRWAATLAEAIGATSRALELWRTACALDPRIGTEFDHAARVLRGSDDASLADLYAAWSLVESNERVSSALRCARGVVDLVRGDLVAAEHALTRAAELDRRDVFCRAALASVYRAGRHHEPLARELTGLAATLISGDARAAVAREHAELLDAHLGAPSTALAMLEQAVVDRPDDDEVMLALARLLDREQQWDRSIALHERAAALAQTPDRRAELWLEIARREDQRGDASAALAAIGKALDTGVRMPELWREQARIHRRAGSYEPALASVRAELEAAPPPARRLQLLLDLAELLGALGREQEAAAGAYEEILAIEPEHPVATARLERLYDQLGRDRELAGLLERRAARTEDVRARAAGLARVAALRSNRGDVDGSIAAYLAAFEADPANRDVFTALERICFKAERWPDAIRLYALAIAHVMTGQDRAYRLGDLYLRLGKVELGMLGQPAQALASFQKGIEVDSDPTEAVELLDQICARTGEWQPLVDAWLRRADVQHNPRRRAEALRAAAALAAARSGGMAAAARIYHTLLELDPGDADAAARLEAYYQAEPDLSGQIAVLRARLAYVQRTDGPGSGAAVKLLQRIARASEEGARDVETATEHYMKLLEVDPDNRDALDALGRIYETTEQWASLIDVTTRLIGLTSDRGTRALLNFKCGSVMEAKFAREEEAIRYYEAAIQATPSCLPALHGLRDLYRRREDWPRVIETLEIEVSAWAEDNERAGVFAQIGRVYADHLANPERATQYFDSALAIDPECLPANQALFDQLFAQGEWERALPIAAQLAQRAMREGDPLQRGEFYRRRGVVLHMTGDVKSATDSLIVALELRPLDARALDDLVALARAYPDAWDFDATFRELEKIYRKRDDAGLLLARVLLARAALLAREGELDAAAALHVQACDLAPADLAVVSALVDFHVNMRRWPLAVEALQRFAELTTSTDDRNAALMRRASIHADGEMDAARAIEVLGEVLALAPDHQEGHYALAQQYFLCGQHHAARQAIERVIELATAQDKPLSAESLARYYYYKGRILDASGDARSAAPQYRRATEYDPGYAPPALVLAGRAVDAGDQRLAETLLIDTAHAAMAQAGPRAAVPLQRGLARILLAAGDRGAAIEAYRGILSVDPDSASDRVALAEILAIDDPQRAIGELLAVIDRDIHHAPAYRLLASFYGRVGDLERATRVLTALDLLGFATDSDRLTYHRLRMSRPGKPVRRALDGTSRARWLTTDAPRAPLGEVWAALAHDLTARVAPPLLGENVLPAATVDARLVRIADEIAALFEVEPQVFVGEHVPGQVAVTAFPSPRIVVDRSLLAEQEPHLRFLFGYAFEAIRGGYAVLLQLGARERRALTQLLRGLIADVAPSGAAAEVIARADARQATILERHAGTLELDPGAWIDGMLDCAKRGGLLASDDFAAAVWMIARLSGESLSSHEDTVALGAVLGGPDLVKFYLSDDYQQLRDALAAAS